MNRRSLFSLRHTLTALATTVLATLAAPELALAATKADAKADSKPSTEVRAVETKGAKKAEQSKSAKSSKESKPSKTQKEDKGAKEELGSKGAKAPAAKPDTKADTKPAKAPAKEADPKKAAPVSLSKPASAGPQPERTKPVHEPSLSKVEASAPETKTVATKASTPKERRSKRTATRGAGKGAERASDSKAPTRRAAREAASKSRCETTSITMDRGGQEAQSLSLVDCRGKVQSVGRRDFSVLARPWSVPRPNAKALSAALKRSTKTSQVKGEEEFAPGVRMLDEGLATRIAAIAKQFPGAAISLVSGYRPSSRGSLHQAGRAVDFHLSGVPNEKVVAFCRTLPDTGCGYYPNSSFVHVDVRDKGQGSATWIDASGPGEAPHYVTEWPPKEPSAPVVVAAAAPPAPKAEGGEPAMDAPSAAAAPPAQSSVVEPTLSLPASLPSASVAAPEPEKSSD